MKEHEIFQSGNTDGIVINDLCEYRMFAEILDDICGEKILSLKMESWGESRMLSYTKEELDAMIGFLTFVRSKMIAGE